MIIADITRGLDAWWAPALAFAAGVVSFASPCVLPLVPGYLSFIAGEAAAESSVEGSGRRKPRLLPIALFILGFTIVFTLLFGFTASALSQWLLSPVGHRVAGGLVLAFGAVMLAYAFRVRVPALYREGRPLLSFVRPGVGGALPLGMAFAVGWTPCIGPVLGAIMTLAANQTSTGRAVLLLFVYSLGLGLPFVVVGLGIGRLMGAFRFFSRNYRWFAGVSGVALAGIGVLLLTGQWTRLIAPLGRAVSRFTPAL